MSCKEIDVRDYFFGELPEAEKHIASCADCTAELDQLRATQATLLMLREEEPPQRIGFVSDKIFQPSPLRRFFESFWLSGARLGFATAAMLSVALITYSSRPQTIASQAEVKAAVAQAVKTAMVEQDKKTRQLLEAADRKHQEKEDQLALRVSEYTTNLDKTMAVNNKMMSISYNSGVRQQ
jgi:hypothetical protein